MRYLRADPLIVSSILSAEELRPYRDVIPISKSVSFVHNERDTAMSYEFIKGCSVRMCSVISKHKHRGMIIGLN